MKSIYGRVLNLRDRISLDGDDTIYEEDYLLLDEVLDYIESSEQRAQEERADLIYEYEIKIAIAKRYNNTEVQYYYQDKIDELLREDDMIGSLDNRKEK